MKHRIKDGNAFLQLKIRNSFWINEKSMYVNLLWHFLIFLSDCFRTLIITHSISQVEKKSKKPIIIDRLDGGAYRIRTGDLYNANVARYQLC